MREFVMLTMSHAAAKVLLKVPFKKKIQGRESTIPSPILIVVALTSHDNVNVTFLVVVAMC